MIKSILSALTSLLDLFKGISCKFGLCCRSECSKVNEFKDRWEGVKGLDGDIKTE